VSPPRVCDEQKFKDLGINHLELYYLDGSIPTNRILQTFLEACETTLGAVAVHCKVGFTFTIFRVS
jgi:cell division cycle 14